MKRIFIAGAFILFVAIVNAQNVGIGTATPVAKLNIVGVGSSPSIPGATSTTAIFRIGMSPNEGIDFGKLPSAPFSAWMQSGSFNVILNPLSLQPLGGNVGIGILSPTAKLHVDGTMKIEGSNTLEFGAGVAGKETNAGKIGYQGFTPGALDIVGAGTTVATRKVNIFAEGGTTFNGPINVGGSTGTAGQVLTSNGTAAPSWTNTAYSNSTRFSAKFIENPAYNGYLVFNSIPVYNLDPAGITIDASGITLAKAGLYHFDVIIYAHCEFPSPQTSPQNFNLFFYNGIIQNRILNLEPMLPFKTFSSTTTTGSLLNKQFTLDTYVVAGSKIRLSNEFISFVNMHDISGFINGYLISE
jgi:hypothetical protein